METAALSTELRGLGRSVEALLAAGLQVAARVVEARELQQEGVERLALLGVERGEEVVAQLRHRRRETDERAPSIAGEADDVPAAVLGVAVTLAEALLLEPIEDADHLAVVDAERVRDHRLGLAGLFGEQLEHAVVVEAEARGLDRLDRAGLEAEPEPSEQEGAVREQLLRQPRRLYDGRVGKLSAHTNEW